MHMSRRMLEKLLPTVDADVRLYTGIMIESAAPLTIFGIIAAILQPGSLAGPQGSKSASMSFTAFSTHSA
jgi:hypothetical protein